MYSDKVKCVAIYNQETSFSNGRLVVGMSNGSINVNNQSLVARMFSPLNNDYKEIVLKKSSIPVAALAGLISASLFFIVGYIFSSEDPLIMAFNSVVFSSPFYVLGHYFSRQSHIYKKYSKEEEGLASSNYSKIYYSPSEHVIFLDENSTLPANRENFEKLLTGKA